MSKNNKEKTFLFFSFLKKSLSQCIHTVFYLMSAGSQISESLNPFVPNVPFFYPRKTSQTSRFSDFFKGKKKGALGTNGLISATAHVLSKVKAILRKLWKIHVLRKQGLIEGSISSFKLQLKFPQVQQGT